jgi:hypothetical protein
LERRNKLTIIAFLVVLSAIFACSHNREFEVDRTGLLYKVAKESESKTELNIGDYIELDLKYSTENDSMLFNSDELGGSFKMQINNVSHSGGSFEDALLMMNPGDSYVFKIPSDSFFLYTKKEYPIPEISKFLLFQISVIRKVPKEEIEQERQLFEEQMQEQENIILAQYIQDEEITVKPKNRVYII